MRALNAILSTKGGFYTAAILLLVCAATLPIAAISVAREARSPGDSPHLITPKDVQPGDTYSNLRLTLQSIDEVNHVANLKVNGYHACAKDCTTYKDKVIFFEVDRDDAFQESLPTSDSVALPSSGTEISAKISLPLRGRVLTFPFDEYTLGIGVVIERESADKTVRVLSPAETRGQLTLTMDEQVARTSLEKFEVVDPKEVRPAKAPFEYAYSAVMILERPAYVKVVTSLVVFLTVVVAVYTMVTRPFDALVINAGAVILGVFGARSLVLQGFPADVTLVDTVFSAVVLFNLLALSFRGMNFFHRKAKLNVLPWARPEPEKVTEKKCPECLSKIPVAATRCAFCAVALPVG